MKIFHLSDLHIGRHLHKYNLADSQKEVFSEIIDIAKANKPDVMIIAGDVFDKSVPSGEAYTIFDEFLTRVNDVLPDMEILVIAGNHDSPERLRYAESFLEKHNIYISVMPPSNEEEKMKCVTLSDEYGEVDFYLLPFTKPSYVRKLFDNGEKISWHDAVKKVIDNQNIDFSRRNVIVSHQFYASSSEKPDGDGSETGSVFVGGLDEVDVDILKDFDYAALGHIHREQKVRYPWVRYSGTPFKYSVSEKNQVKSILEVDLGEKGKEISVIKHELNPSLDVKVIKGSLDFVIDEGLKNAKIKGEARYMDYVQVILTDDDEAVLTDAKSKLDEVYGHLLEIRVDNKRTRECFNETSEIDEEWTIKEAFDKFFFEINHREMNDNEITMMNEIWEEMEKKDEAD